MEFELGWHFWLGMLETKYHSYLWVPNLVRFCCEDLLLMHDYSWASGFTWNENLTGYQHFGVYRKISAHANYWSAVIYAYF